MPGARSALFHSRPRIREPGIVDQSLIREAGEESRPIGAILRRHEKSANQLVLQRIVMTGAGRRAGRDGAATAGIVVRTSSSGPMLPSCMYGAVSAILRSVR